jgi:transcriptional regulator with XRE-family HTH domain
MVISIEDRLASPYLKTLSKNLTSMQEKSGLKKPDFAEFIGMSGSQFRYVRARAANPSIDMLATIAKRLKMPLYELLENDKLAHRRNPSAAEMNEVLSAIVKEKYKASGLANDEFANYIGVSIPQFYLILRGVANPSLLVVAEIAKRLNVGMWQLLGVEPVEVQDAVEG